VRLRPQTTADYMRRYPRIVAHIICASISYANPTLAAQILKHAKKGLEHECAWISSSYNNNAVLAVKDAIRMRDCHIGYQTDFRTAYAVVRRAIDTGVEPLVEQWF
jgi:hypothetical protein